MIYLDCAATAMQKPPVVASRMAWAANHLASPGRGGHRPAMLAGEIAFQCRQTAAELFHVESPEQVVFTFNATHGLNIAIKTLVKPGMTVLISGYEHNAVTRPLNAIPGVHLKVAASPLFCPNLFLEDFERKCTDEVSVAVCTHVSNVFGYILPIREVADVCRRRGIPLIVDASQSAGCLPVHMDELDAAFVAMPGHKGLYGPQGTGLLLCGENAQPLLYGGTGSASRQQNMPEFLPDRLEAGTHNVPGIAGLLEGMRFVRSRGVDRILAHERALIKQLTAGLSDVPGVQIYADAGMHCQSGVCSLCCERMGCEELGEELGRRGIAVRAGLHCAPLAHQTAGTLLEGTVRVSVSAFNTKVEIKHFLGQLRTVLATRG